MAREGRAVQHLNRRRSIAPPRSGDLAAPTTAGRKGDHQDRPLTQIAQAVARARGQQFCQNVVRNRLGLLRRRVHGIARTEWLMADLRAGKCTIEAAPFH